MKTALLNSDPGGRTMLTRIALLAILVIGLQFSSFAQLSGSINSIADVSCNGGNDGAIDINVSGGTPPYSFSWNNGATSEDISGVTAGNYSVTITDAALASVVVNATVAEPAALSVVKVVKDVTCNGGTDGSVNLTVSGGTAPYSFAWSNGATTEDIASQPSGPFSVTVSDSKGCSVVVVDTIGEPSLFFIVASSKTDVTCNGGSDGSISITVAGGILPYTFLWSNGAITEDLTNIPAGTYNLVASDNNGCKDYATIVVNQPPTAITASYTVTNSTCYFSNDGAVDLTVSGGNPPYNFAWSNGATSEDLTGVSAGNYTVTITDANGCVNVQAPAILAQDAIPPVAVCQNINAYLDASGNVLVNAADLDNGSTDNCALDSFAISQSAFTCANIGPNPVQFIAFDSNGNSDTCAAVINVMDTTAPGIGANSVTLFLDITGQASLDVVDVDNGTTDACGIDTMFIDRSVFGCADLGLQLIQFTAIDNQGNSASAFTTVWVRDTNSPVASANNISVSLDQTGNVTITPADINNGSSDACGIDTMYLDVNTFDCSQIGVQNVTLFVEDSEGNVSSAPAQVTVVDDLAPQFTAVNYTLYLDNTGNGTIQASDVTSGLADNCALDTVILDQYNYNCAGVGINIVGITASDIYGNNDMQFAQVTVVDTNSPQITTNNAVVYLDAAGQGSIALTDIQSAVSVSCGLDTSYLDRYNFSCADLGVNTVNLIAVSVNGVMASAPAQVTVIDTITPVAIAQNLTVYLDAAGSASIVPAQVDKGSMDACGVDSLALDQSLFGCADLGAVNVNLSVFDVSGNVAVAPAVIQVLDTIRPSLVTKNITVYLNANGEVALNANDLVDAGADNCSMLTASVNPDTLGCSEIGSNNVMVSLADASGNTVSAVAEVTVIDTIDPVVQAQDLTVYLDATGSVSVSAATVDAGSGTACGMDALFLDRSVFGCADLGPNTVILTGTKANGTSSSDTAVITVLDTLGPLPVVPAIDLYLDAAGSAAISSLSVASFIDDPCGFDSLWIARDSFDCADLGATNVFFRAYDVLGNITEDSLLVNVHDTMAPQLATQNISIYISASGSVNVAVGDVSQFASDVCGIDTIYLDRYSFDCSEVGLNTVNVTAADIYGNTRTAPAQVMVLDTILPSASARNLTVYVNANGIAQITPAMVDAGSADGNCQYNVVLTDSIFDCAELGLNLEQLIISDAAGNSDTADFFVTVLDTIKPTLALRDITLSLDQNGKAFINDASIFDSLSTDNCANNLSFTVTKTEYDCDDIGAHSVIVTAEDDKLNVAASSAWVYVVDNLAPTMAVRTATAYLDASGKASLSAADVDNGTYDVCGIDTMWIDKTQFTIADLGVKTITLYARDASGNVNLAPALVNVVDTLSPGVSTQPVNLYLNANGTAFLNGSVGVYDNHAVTAVNYSKTLFSCADTGMSLIGVTAQDPSGNVGTGALAVQVWDTLAPVVSGNNVSIYLDAAGVATLTLQDVNASANDNCAVKSMSLSQTSFGCADVGARTVQLIGTDYHNNNGMANLVITVLDTIKPQLTNIPNDTIVEANPSLCGAYVVYSVPSVADVCGWTNFSSSEASGSFFNLGTTKVIFTLTDASGNTVQKSFNVTVVDNTPPQVVAAPVNDTIGVCQSYYYFNLPTAVDNCSGATVTQIAGIPSGGYYPVGSTVNSFKIVDGYGNDTVVSFEVLVEPLGQPTLPAVLTLCENDDPVDFSQGQSVQWSGKGMSANLFDPAQAGVGIHYMSYNFIDDNGCQATGNISVTVVPKPTKPVISRIGSNTLSTGAYDFYQWYRDGQPIAGANGQTLKYTTGGNYQVMVTNTVSCSDHSDGFVVGNSGGGIGIDELDLAQVSIYPNPSEGIVTIDLGLFSQEEVQISVHSISGQMIYQFSGKSNTEGKLTLDLRNNPPAAYFVQISSAGNSVTRKIILQ